MQSWSKTCLLREDTSSLVQSFAALASAAARPVLRSPSRDTALRHTCRKRKDSAQHTVRLYFAYGELSGKQFYNIKNTFACLITVTL